MAFQSLRSLVVAAVAAAPLALALPAGAHHSFGAFDQSKSEIVNGTVKEWQWTNPHAFMTIAGQNEAGRAGDYVIEWPAPMQLQQRGYTRNLAKVGDKVKLTFRPKKDGTPGGLFTDITSPEGKSLKAHEN